ncbi:hypothetical protein IEQ34_001130 [Dendrobium chrysotoxum]|uniref:Uncharacterized protein n=1 Tax=Dendrobium chrysotoxum TaxID=161865 RepID=A0AAV7HKZ8_DENCH|nr:hypothetical protein IEQ34_001130 [Dendrobium chrysotoxum]
MNPNSGEAATGGHAERTFTPGATMSGFSTPPFIKLGPREENAATAGDGRAPNTVLLKTIAATGVDVEYT